MDTLVQDAPFMNFLAVVAVAIVGGWVSIQIRKLDRKNSQQHNENKAIAEEKINAQTEKLSGKLELIHEDVRLNTTEIAVLGEKLDNHVHDPLVHR